MRTLFKTKKKEVVAPKVGLALSGGTTYGIAHVGALRALIEQGIPIDCISGTSAGSLVAAAYAFGMPLSQLLETVEQLSWKKLSRFSYSRMGLSSNKPMGTFITDTFGDVKIEDAKVPLAIIATNIETHEKVVLRHGSLHEAIRASTSIPGMFAPVEVDGALLVDGGLTENLPLSPLGEMGATFKIGINLSANPATYRPKNMLEVLYASVAVLSRHRDSNLLLDADVIIEPDLHRFDSTKFKDVQEIIDEGYRATLAAVPRIRELLRPPQKKRGVLGRVRSVFGY